MAEVPLATSRNSLPSPPGKLFRTFKHANRSALPLFRHLLAEGGEGGEIREGNQLMSEGKDYTNTVLKKLISKVRKFAHKS